MATADHLLDDNGQVRFKFFNKNGARFIGMPMHDDRGMIELLDGFDALKARPDDIWVCAFAKSGTHWVWEIVSMLMSKSTELVEEMKETGFLDMHGAEAMEALKSPRILNTHCTVQCMPPDVFAKNSKIIYIMRNPKDVEVSHYHHFKKIFRTENTFEEHVNDRLVRSIDTGGWYDNVLGWHNAHKNTPSVLFIKYEDIQKDHLKHIRMIAKFLGQPEDKHLFQQILEKTSFQHMQAHKKDHFKMYRKGKVGGWKDYFTVAMNEEYDREYAERLKDTDLTLDFEI